MSKTTGQGEDANTEEIPTAVITLAVDQKDAEKLIFATDQSQLYFGLLTPKSATAASDGVNDTNIWAN